MFRTINFVLAIFLFSLQAKAELAWKTLPPTPRLPKEVSSGYAPVNHIHLWYATYGEGEPVILLHGGLANSDYWGNQVSELSKYYKVIVVDSRGHGRSDRDKQPFSYDLMASDVIGLMNYLKIKKASIVGWSDGAIIGLKIAISNPEYVSQLFSFAANSSPDGVKEDVADSPVVKEFTARAKEEYKRYSTTPDQFDEFVQQISKMWETQPNLTKEQLHGINVRTWIVDGDHDEGIKLSDTEFMAGAIPNAGLLIQPEVGHFSFLQKPQQFTQDLLRFLKHNDSKQAENPQKM